MKKIFTSTALLMLLFTGSAFASNPGKVLVIVSIEVKDVAAWKKMFDAGAPIREKAGITVISIGNSTENEHKVTVVEEAENEKAAKDFVAVLQSKVKAGDMANLEVSMFHKMD